MTLKEAVCKVLEGWTLPNAVRKILEEAYFAEPQRTWVGLTDEDCEGMPSSHKAIAKLVESKLREKNQ